MEILELINAVNSGQILTKRLREDIVNKLIDYSLVKEENKRFKERNRRQFDIITKMMDNNPYE